MLGVDPPRDDEKLRAELGPCDPPLMLPSRENEEPPPRDDEPPPREDEDASPPRENEDPPP
jgi:hypothetical protein